MARKRHPITDTKRARTTVTLRNHETAVIGGFITETVARDRRGIPMLSNVPVLGNAFATSANAKTRTELVFLVTVNAEEPPALVTDRGGRPGATGPGPCGTAASTDPVRERPRVERIDMGGGLR